MIFADLALARRLESAEAQAGRAFVEARRRLDPAAPAEWLEVAGVAGSVVAAFDGPESPVTQTFGLGLFAEVSDAVLAQLERFFHERGAPVFHEVSPLAGVPAFARLVSRGYRPVELTSVLYQPVASPLDHDACAVGTRMAAPGEEDLWSETALRGWIGDHPEYREFLLQSGRVTAHSAGTRAYFAEIDGRPVATGVLRCFAGVAHFAGAATVPEARGRGAQQALLAARMREAAAQGCDLAFMCAAPGSASQRNAERHGFRIAYTRVKWELAENARP